jgi:pantoate--beta-alanine ligase
MEVFSTVNELQDRIKKLSLKPVAFVPTMGALHKGHLTLVAKAIEKCPLVVVSIFVNPTQFNDKNDLKNYPRTLEKDLELLNKVLRKTDLVFTPEVSEIYPEEDKRVFHFGNLDNVMEALHRHGHFNGVAQVVSRLFEIINPDLAIFGIKDFQQLAVIKAMVRQTGSKVEIMGHPIIREDDGLAMSSRNQLLEPDIRKRSPIIFETIREASEMINKKEISEIKEFVLRKINNTPGFSIEYFEIADDKDLIPVNAKNEMTADKQYYGCIAVKAGKIRLIDNIKMDWSKPKG